jgi:hypothetical protein
MIALIFIGLIYIPSSGKFNMGYAQSNQLGLSVFTTSYDDELTGLLKKYIDKNDYIIDSSGKVFQQDFQDFRKIVGGPSLAGLEKAMDLSKGFLTANDAVVYDIEHWELTPKEEQDDPVSAFNKGADTVHSAGYKFGIAPDRIYLLQYYKETDWKKIDLLVMQMQRVVTDINEFSSSVREVAQFVRAANPGIEILVQISLTLSQPDALIKAVQSVKDDVDGVVVVYLPNANRPGNNSTLQNLDKVFSQVAELRNAGKLERGELFDKLTPVKRSIKAEGQNFDVHVANNSNADIDFKQDQKKLAIAVSAGSNSVGLLEITMPYVLLDGNYSVIVDGKPVPIVIVSIGDTGPYVQQSNILESFLIKNMTEAKIQIMYDNTTPHQIDIIGTSVIPELHKGFVIILAFAIPILILKLGFMRRFVIGYE